MLHLQHVRVSSLFLLVLIHPSQLFGLIHNHQYFQRLIKSSGKLKQQYNNFSVPTAGFPFPSVNDIHTNQIIPDVLIYPGLNQISYQQQTKDE